MRTKLGIRLKVISFRKFQFLHSAGKEVLTWHHLSRVLICKKYGKWRSRIRELRQIEGLTTAEMATKTDISEEDYIHFEGRGSSAFIFVAVPATALALSVPDIIKSSSPRLNAYVSYTQKGQDSKFRKPTRWCITESGGGFQKPHRPTALRYQQI